MHQHKRLVEFLSVKRGVLCHVAQSARAPRNSGQDSKKVFFEITSGERPAESTLRQALEIARRLNGDNSPRVSIASNYLAQLLYLKGDYAVAEEAATKSLAICKQLLPEGHPGFASPMTILGLIMNKTGRSTQAESFLRQALAIRERVLAKGAWQIATTQGALGECLTSQKHYAEAEPLLIQSYDVLKQTQGEQNPRTLEARQRLVQLYEAWGKLADATRYR